MQKNNYIIKVLIIFILIDVVAMPLSIKARFIRHISAVYNSIRQIKFDRNSTTYSVALSTWFVPLSDRNATLIQTSNFCRVKPNTL